MNEEVRMFLENMKDLLAYKNAIEHPLRADNIIIHKDTSELMIQEIERLLNNE